MFDLKTEKKKKKSFFSNFGRIFYHQSIQFLLWCDLIGL